MGYFELTRQLKRGQAAKRLQTWWRRRKLRHTWIELIEDVMGYFELMRQLKRAQEAKRLQNWWRHVSIRKQWRELIEDVKAHYELVRRQTEAQALDRLQRWAKRVFLRRQWLRLVEEAKARRQFRQQLFEALAREAVMRHWASVLIQSHYRGMIGRWLARTLKQAGYQVYEEQVRRREQMLQQYKVREAKRREAAAAHIQQFYRRRMLLIRMQKQVTSVLLIQRFTRHVRARRKWLLLLSEVTTYSLMVARRDAVVKRLQAAGKQVVQLGGLQPERVGAAIRLQRFVRSKLTRRKWHAVIRDLGTYALMAGRREAVLRKVGEERGKAKAAPKVQRPLTVGEAVEMLQGWWRRTHIRHQWKDLIQDLTVNAELRRKKRRNDAALKLQQWLRRVIMRRHWLRVVEEAKARRQLRMLIKEELARDAAMRNWAVVLVQAAFRGMAGRWLARARKQVDEKTYDDLVHRREQMLQQYKVREAKRREACATIIQLWWRRQMRHHDRLAMMNGHLPWYTTSVSLASLQRSSSRNVSFQAHTAGGNGGGSGGGSFKRGGGGSGGSGGSVCDSAGVSTCVSAGSPSSAGDRERRSVLGHALNESATELQAYLRDQQSRRSSASTHSTRSPSSSFRSSHRAATVRGTQGTLPYHPSRCVGMTASQRLLSPQDMRR